MEEYYLMWLTRIDGIGLKRAHRLLEHFGSAEAVWRAEPSAIRRSAILGEKLTEGLLLSREEDQLNDWIIELEEKEIDFYSYWHPRYPRLLREIQNPPLGIYVRGEIPDDEIDTVAIIGARKCSRYGATVAYDIAKDLGKTNVIVVSGMARGIDSEGHRGILDGGGKTIAVLGVDICYPAENKELMERIIENGCVISEYPPGMPAVAKNFPNRNRIIAGLSKMVVVVEAGKRSGTIITADLALEQGKDVYALPGPVNSSLSQGCNRLIFQGAGILLSPENLLDEMGIAYSGECEKSDKNKKMLESPEYMVYSCVGLYPKSVGQLTEETKLRPEEVLKLLVSLELQGYIREISKNYYIKVK